MSKAQLAHPARPPLPDRRHPRLRTRRRPALHPPGRGLRSHGVPAGPRARPRRPAPHPGGPAHAGTAARRQGVRGVRGGVREAVGLDHDGVRPPAAQPGARPHRGLAGGADRLRRGPHLRARATDRRGQDLRAGRPALHPRRRRPAAELRRELLGAGPPGGHHRGRRAGDVHRAVHRVRHLGPADGAGLPLLFDVRLPAGRRPRLGAGRHAGAGHPGRVHGRAHDAHGRGAAARRRAVAAPRLHQPGGHGLRRLVRLRGGRHHGGGGHRDARSPTPRTASGTSPSTTRPTRCRPCPRERTGEAVRRGIIEGLYRFAEAPETPGDLRASLCFSGPMWQRRRRGAAHPGRALRRGRRHLGRHVVDEPAHRRPRGGALEPAAPRGGTPHGRASRRRSATGPTPWWPSPTTCAPVPDQVARFVERAVRLARDRRLRALRRPRDALRSYFEVDGANLVVAVLQQLALGGRIEPSIVAGRHRRIRHRPPAPPPSTSPESIAPARRISAPPGLSGTIHELVDSFRTYRRTDRHAPPRHRIATHRHRHATETATATDTATAPPPPPPPPPEPGCNVTNAAAPRSPPTPPRRRRAPTGRACAGPAPK